MDDQHMPRTSVAFAATVPFSKRWPDEAKAQMKKFERSTWAQVKIYLLISNGLCEKVENQDPGCVYLSA